MPANMSFVQPRQVVAPQAPPLPAVAQLPGGGENLQAQLQALNEQLGALSAQRRVLQRQQSYAQPAVRQAAQARLPVVEQQIAQATLDIAALKGRLDTRDNTQQFAQQFGRIAIQPPRIYRRTGLQGGEIAAVMTLAFVCGAFVPVLFRRFRRRKPGPPTQAAHPSLEITAQRFERLEHAVDVIAIEIERVSEGQRFITKVFAERPAGTARSADPGQPDRSDAALFRALGAGPIEPIRVAERQAVRPSVTPH